MVDTTAAIASPSRFLSRRFSWGLFLAATTAASLLPIVFIPVARHVFPDAKAAIYGIALFNLLGAQFHVAATGWFFTDPQIRGFFRQKPGRYLIAPAAIVVGSSVVFGVVGATTRSYLIVAYLIWQLWHYQKQNFGLLSFVAAGTDRVSLTRWERRTLALAFLPGALGFLHFFEVGLPQYAQQFASMHGYGGFAYVLVAPCFLMAVLSNEALRRNPLRLAFFTFGTLFFLPTYLFPDGVSAITGFALAHGLQYLVFMTVVSGRGVHRPLVSLGVMVAIAFAGWWLLTGSLAVPGVPEPIKHALWGAGLGVVMAHFVIDAGLWRMRESFQRGYIAKKFDFIFAR